MKIQITTNRQFSSRCRCHVVSNRPASSLHCSYCFCGGFTEWALAHSLISFLSFWIGLKVRWPFFAMPRCSITFIVRCFFAASKDPWELVATLCSGNDVHTYSFIKMSREKEESKDRIELNYHRQLSDTLRAVCALPLPTFPESKLPHRVQIAEMSHSRDRDLARQFSSLIKKTSMLAWVATFCMFS